MQSNTLEREFNSAYSKIAPQLTLFSLEGPDLSAPPPEEPPADSSAASANKAKRNRKKKVTDTDADDGDSKPRKGARSSLDAETAKPARKRAKTEASDTGSMSQEPAGGDSAGGDGNGAGAPSTEPKRKKKKKAQSKKGQITAAMEVDTTDAPYPVPVALLRRKAAARVAAAEAAAAAAKAASKKDTAAAVKELMIGDDDLADLAGGLVTRMQSMF